MLSRTKRIVAVLSIGGLLAGGTVVYRYRERTKVLPTGLIQVNGRMEGDIMTVASKAAGRIAAVLAREGDVVEAGQILAQLEDKTIRARLAQAQAAQQVATARAKAARAVLNVLCQEVPCHIAAAEAGVKAADAMLAKARAAEEQARRESQRFRTLADTGKVDMQTAEQKELAWKVAREELEAARAALTRAQQTLQDARLGPERIQAQEAELAAVVAAEHEAAARLAEARSTLEDLTLAAPAAGTITMRLADLGEVVQGGTPLFEVVNLDRLYLKVYVPEVDIGKVRLGLAAQIYTDAFPEEPFAAVVRYIASKAEFTPKEVQTPAERVKLVYEVRLYVQYNPQHRLTPGLPADAVIRWQEETPWSRPRW